MISLASISSCKKYRYSLDRIRDEKKDICVWIMLNPSIADANIDDPTIRRVINFSKQYGYGGCHIVNLFSLRSTDPKELKKSLDPIGEETTKYYIDSLKYKTIICARGNHGIYNNRSFIVKNFFHDNKVKLYCLGINTTTGEPKHPLYVSKDTILKKL